MHKNKLKIIKEYHFKIFFKSRIVKLFQVYNIHMENRFNSAARFNMDKSEKKWLTKSKKKN